MVCSRDETKLQTGHAQEAWVRVKVGVGQGGSVDSDSHKALMKLEGPAIAAFPYKEGARLIIPPQHVAMEERETVCRYRVTRTTRQTS